MVFSKKRSDSVSISTIAQVSSLSSPDATLFDADEAVGHRKQYLSLNMDMMEVESGHAQANTGFPAETYDTRARKTLIVLLYPSIQLWSWGDYDWVVSSQWILLFCIAQNVHHIDVDTNP